MYLSRPVHVSLLNAGVIVNQRGKLWATSLAFIRLQGGDLSCILRQHGFNEQICEFSRLHCVGFCVFAVFYAYGRSSLHSSLLEQSLKSEAMSGHIFLK